MMSNTKKTTIFVKLLKNIKVSIMYSDHTYIFYIDNS